MQNVATPGLIGVRTTKSKLSGWYFYDRLEELARDIHDMNATGENVYFNIAPVHEDLLDRADHRFLPGPSSKACDIVRRARLLIDVDAVKADGFEHESATDEEKAEALAVMRAVVEWLTTTHAWPAPALVDSGNGYHIYYQIDLPANDGGLVERVLKSLAARFSTTGAKVDTSVHDACRIAKAPGTVAYKGTHTESRPFRTSFLFSSPDKWETVTRDQLEAVGTKVEVVSKPRGNLAKYWEPEPTPVSQDRGIILQRVREYLAEVPGAISFQGGHRHTLKVAIKLVKGWLLTFSEALMLMLEWNEKCDEKWTELELIHKLEDAFKSPAVADGHLLNRPRDDAGSTLWPTATVGAQASSGGQILRPVPLTGRQMIAAYPALRPAIVKGLLRQGETMNVICSSKVGKSWLVLDLALCVSTGRDWLGSMAVDQGRVLIVDNELHGETITDRIKKVAEKKGINFDEWADDVHFFSLRGQQCDLAIVEKYLIDVPYGYYRLVIIDAWYRVMPDKVDENDNGAITKLYNLVDAISARLGCAVVLIHHASKGNQGSKAVTDVGSGAGAQSRAADTHMVLRQHEADNVFVADAAVRSWPRFPPVCIEFTWPIWIPRPELDPSQLKQDRSRGRAAAEIWTPAKLVEFCGPEQRHWAEMLTALNVAGCSRRKADELLANAVVTGQMFELGRGPKKIVSTTKPTPVIYGIHSEPHLPDVKPGRKADDAKRDAVLACLSEHPDWAIAKVATECKVDRKVVREVKNGVGKIGGDITGENAI